MIQYFTWENAIVWWIVGFCVAVARYMAIGMPKKLAHKKGRGFPVEKFDWLSFIIVFILVVNLWPIIFIQRILR